MDRRDLERVVHLVGPYIQDGKLERSRIQQALGAIGAGPDLASRLSRALTEAAILVVEDVAVDVLPSDPQPSVESREVAAQEMEEEARHPTRAIAAARDRLKLDRRMRRLDKVLLTPREVVGLSLILRGPNEAALAQGEFACLTGERRAAAQSLLLHNLGLIGAVARRVHSSGMEYDDVFQSGVIGLMRAVELFDPTAGYRFATYATVWIRQATQRAVANEGRLIRIPVHMFERIQKVSSARERLTRGQHPPAISLLAEECGLTEVQVRECLTLGIDPVSLDMPVADSVTTLGDLLDMPTSDGEREEVNGHAPEEVFGWLAKLDERQAKIIALRFGLASTGEPMTLDEIGHRIGVSRERVRQIESDAIESLRAVAEGLPDPQSKKRRKRRALNVVE